jgi:branched-subunit amino acid transport protein
VARGALLQSLAMLVVAFAPDVGWALLAMFAAGMAWITTANSLSVSAQMGLPGWVRARGMSVFQMAIMGAAAVGAALWGQVATLASVQTSLLIAAGTGAISIFVANRLMVDNSVEEDLTPTRNFKIPVVDVPPVSGHIVSSIEYLIDPAQADAFRKLMLESRRNRLSHGALSWELLRDIGQPGRYVEQIIDASWADHLRRFERVTAIDAALRDRKLGFHVGESPPVVTRSVVESTVRHKDSV